MVVNNIADSPNGRTSGFSPEYRGLSPCTPAREKTPIRVFFRESWGKESLGDFPSRTRSPIELDYERSDII